ncbi:MAG: tryptophan-rich sensory protein [Clostridia bacterium]|nr:tryptophan-rich sensory protein [Clostridia bacterium]
MERTKKAWVNAIFFVITLAVNTLGALGLINGLSQKEISDRYVTLITPSPSTFSIWSVIYTLLLAAVIMMIVKKADTYYQKAVDEISLLFRLSSLFNIAWIVTFSYVLVEISVLFIVAFVITLAMLNQKLRAIHESKRWLLPAAFGMYTGWLTIATVVNIAAALVKIEWNRFGLSEELWAVIILAVSAVLVILIFLRLENVIYPLPVAWAYFGIYQFLNAPEGFKGQYNLVEVTALIGMVVLIGAAAIQLYRNRFRILPVAQN